MVFDDTSVMYAGAETKVELQVANRPESSPGKEGAKKTPITSARDQTQLCNHAEMDEPSTQATNQSQAAERMDLESNYLDKNQGDEGMDLEMYVDPAIDHINMSMTEAFQTV